MATVDHPDCPVRAHLDDPGTVWKYGGPPDYTLVDGLYLKGKRNQHKADSLEKLVENLVKSWEAESTHKGRVEDWMTVERETFRISVNGGPTYNLPETIAMGNYKMMLGDCPFYNAKQETVESALQVFKDVFKTGFAWEVLEVYTGPPVVSFKWHHWGVWDGKFKTEDPTGETIEMFGSCVARVSDRLLIESVEVFYDPNPMMAKLTGFQKKCPAFVDNLEK